MKNIQSLRVKLFADGADLTGIREMAANPIIEGFTTNPTLMRRAGVSDYHAFARQVIDSIGARPVSFEVLADDFMEMERQAFEIASWGQHVSVKIPVTNTRGEFSGPLVERLSHAGVRVNITALTTVDQVRRMTAHLATETAATVSVLAGRIADTGCDPVPLISDAVTILRAKPKAELMWASTRELLNIFQADSVGCHIITASHDILKKLSLVGSDLDACSLETVEMFYRDAKAAAYEIRVSSPAENGTASGAARVRQGWL